MNYVSTSCHRLKEAEVVTWQYHVLRYTYMQFPGGPNKVLLQVLVVVATSTELSGLMRGTPGEQPAAFRDFWDLLGFLGLRLYLLTGHNLSLKSAAGSHVKCARSCAMFIIAVLHRCTLPRYLLIFNLCFVSFLCLLA